MSNLSETAFSMILPDAEINYSTDPKDSIFSGTTIGYTILVACSVGFFDPK
jgi:hypothetical protein